METNNKMNEKFIIQMLEELDIFSRNFLNPDYGLPIESENDMKEMIRIVRKYEQKQSEYWLDSFLKGINMSHEEAEQILKKYI